MNSAEFLKSLLPRIKEQNKEWWIDLDTGKPHRPPTSEKLVLVYTELAEAVEAERKNLNDDHLPHRKGVEVELADAVIRLLDFYTGYNLTFEIKFNEDVLNTIDRKDIRSKTEFFMTLFDWTNEFYDYGSGYEFNVLLTYIFLYGEKYGLDLEGAIVEKLDYNLTRKDHTLEARKAANGKKF